MMAYLYGISVIKRKGGISMPEINFFGHILVEILLLATAIWENPDGSTVVIPQSSIQEILATRNQINASHASANA